MSNHRLERIIRDLVRQGAEARRSRKGWVLRLPDGSSTTFHRTPSDQRAVRNQRADIERAGLTWPGKRR